MIFSWLNNLFQPFWQSELSFLYFYHLWFLLSLINNFISICFSPLWHDLINDTPKELSIFELSFLKTLWKELIDTWYVFNLWPCMFYCIFRPSLFCLKRWNLITHKHDLSTFREILQEHQVALLLTWHMKSN